MDLRSIVIIALIVFSILIVLVARSYRPGNGKDSGVSTYRMHEDTATTEPDSAVSAEGVIPRKGAYYWCPADSAVVKVLAIDEQGVHLRIYANHFPTKPESIRAEEMTLDSMDGISPGGMGHIPLRLEGFILWEPQLIQEGTVEDDELEGYKIWQEAKGGYF
jgi:hypothetical protein